MIRHQTGQFVGCQLTNAIGGTDFAGTATVYVTGDAGTQTTGIGTVTYKGRGYHIYEPTAAETDFTVIAYTFTGPTAVSKTVEVETEGLS